MISRQKQIYELRKAVISELELRTVKKRMIATLENKGQRNTGNLRKAIEKIQYNKALKVTNTAFDETTGAMYKATVTFDLSFGEAGYAKFLDNVYYPGIPYQSRGKGIQNLIEWIKNKPKATWRTNFDTSDERKVRRLAHNIFKAQIARGGVKNKSNFITFSRSNITTAINKGAERFVDYLSSELYLEIKRQIFVGNGFKY